MAGPLGDSRLVLHRFRRLLFVPGAERPLVGVQKHRRSVEFLHEADYARRRTVVGKFPDAVVEQFRAMLDYFGQSPIIVRSSSLLEDSFGHSFAGKYASVFLASQGSPTQRLQDFMAAVRTIYASTMSEEALTYRHRRGMLARTSRWRCWCSASPGRCTTTCSSRPRRRRLLVQSLCLERQDRPRAGVLRLVFGWAPGPSTAPRTTFRESSP